MRDYTMLIKKTEKHANRYTNKNYTRETIIRHVQHV